MNPAAILALIADLYQQVQQVSAERDECRVRVDGLERVNAALTAENAELRRPTPRPKRAGKS